MSKEVENVKDSELNPKDILTVLSENIDRYDIWFGGESRYRRNEMNYDVEKDGQWVKWEDVETILKCMEETSKLKVNGKA